MTHDSPPVPSHRPTMLAESANDTGAPTGRNYITTGNVRRALFILAMPVLAEQLLNTFVGLFDVWLAGRISAAATSAIGLAAYVAWLASMIVMLVGMGTTALVARQVGAGDHAEANRFSNQSLTLAVFVGLLVFALIYSLAPWLARYSNMTGDAFHMTVDYLRIDALGYTAMSLTIVGCAALRGAGDMRMPMFIFAVVNTVNVFASLTFVYGWGPFPEMGVRGIVCGTLTARLLGAVLTLWVLLRGRSGLKICFEQLRISWSRAARLLRIGGPAAIDGAIMWSGHFAFLAIVTRLAAPPPSDVYFAAHIVAIRVEAFTYLPAMAWASAVATMIGQSLGAGDVARAKRAGYEGVLQCGLLSCVVAFLFYFGAEFIYRQMSLDSSVGDIGAGPFRLLALFQPAMVVSIVFVGAFRGAGETRYPLLITVIGIVLIRLPLGYYFGIVCEGGLIGAWIGMFGDMLWRAIATTLRYARGKWLRTQI